MLDVWCSNRHKLVRFEIQPCQVHGQHRVYRCPMRLGARRCAEVVVHPRVGAGCAP